MYTLYSITITIQKQVIFLELQIKLLSKNVKKHYSYLIR